MDSFKRNLVPDTKNVEYPSWECSRSKYYGISTEFPYDSFDIELKDNIAWIKNMPRGTHVNTDL